jgi:hypothetical protein
MSTRVRRLAAAGTVLACATAIAMLALPRSPSVPDPAAPTAGNPRVTPQPPAVSQRELDAQPQQHDDGHIGVERDRSGRADRPRRGAGTLRAATRSARGFLRGFLRYERGDRTAGSIMVPFAEARLVGTLLAQPPRIPPSSPRPHLARLRRFESAERLGKDRVDVVAVLERGGRETSMLLTLRGHGGRWLVSALG